jgi:heterotetrameric sarcosine oxidase gamma subunit
MFELTRTPVLEAATLGLSGGVEVRALPPQVMLRVQVARHALRNEPAALAAAAAAACLPREPGYMLGEEPRAWWLAPNGWLVTARYATPAVLAENLHRALAPLLHSVVDVSDAHVALELRGARARDLLARGTGVDLQAAEFAPGRCLRTRCAHAPVLLRPLAGPDVELILDRSLARQFCEWLSDAAVGLEA